MALNPPKKKQKTKEKKRKRNKEGLGPSEVALRATSPDPYTLQKNKKQRKQKKNKKNKKKKKPQKKNSKNTQKWAFQLSVKFFLFFGWLFKISLFWHLRPKSLNPKNTINIGVSGPFFGKAVVRHETAIFGPKKPKFINFSYHCFLPIFFSFNNQKTQKVLKPLFL